jgi:hypothetical protein
MRIKRRLLVELINEEMMNVSEANSGVDPKTGRSWSISPMTGEKHWGGPAGKDVPEQENATAAIDNARNQRDDGLSFEDFARLVIDQLNLYDEWLSNASAEDVVAELTGNSQGMTQEDEDLAALIDRQAREMAGDLSGPDWEPGPGYDASDIGESETSEGTPLTEMPASWQQILRNVL